MSVIEATRLAFIATELSKIGKIVKKGKIIDFRIDKIVEQQRPQENLKTHLILNINKRYSCVINKAM